MLLGSSCSPKIKGVRKGPKHCDCPSFSQTDKQNTIPSQNFKVNEDKNG